MKKRIFRANVGSPKGADGLWGSSPFPWGRASSVWAALHFTISPEDGLMAFTGDCMRVLSDKKLISMKDIKSVKHQDRVFPMAFSSYKATFPLAPLSRKFWRLGLLLLPFLISMRSNDRPACPINTLHAILKRNTPHLSLSLSPCLFYRKPAKLLWRWADVETHLSLRSATVSYHTLWNFLLSSSEIETRLLPKVSFRISQAPPVRNHFLPSLFEVFMCGHNRSDGVKLDP